MKMNPVPPLNLADGPLAYLATPICLFVSFFSENCSGCFPLEGISGLPAVRCGDVLSIFVSQPFSPSPRVDRPTRQASVIDSSSYVVFFFFSRGVS